MEDKGEFINFLKKAKEFVWNRPGPFSMKEGGRPAYNPKSMTLCYLLKERFSLTYRETESLLKSNKELIKILELEKIPGKSSIQRTLERLPKKYVESLFNDIACNFKKRS
jgi:hypothetical protein